MDHLVNVEDSYAERRQLFKNVWDTATNIENKNANNKPKIIKTLRLDEVDRSAMNKKKKMKWKNLRSACNKLLDFYDNPDVDSIIYEEVKARNQPTYLHIKHKKVKKCRLKRKVKKSRNLSLPTEDPTQAKVTLSERNIEFTEDSKENLLYPKPGNVTQPRSPKNTSAFSNPTRRNMMKKHKKKRKRSLP